MAAIKNLAGASVRCAACEAAHTVPVRLGLKRDLQRRDELDPGIPSVPIGRQGDVRCPKCGYICAAILARCPQCQNYLRKGSAILRQCMRVAKIILIIGLGWFLAANFSSIKGCLQGLCAAGNLPAVSPAGPVPDSADVFKTSATGAAARK